MDDTYKNSLNEAIKCAPYFKAYTNGGQSILASPFADKSDFTDNVAAAKKIVDKLKTNVKIRPHLLIDKNPELEIFSEITDLKMIHSIKRLNSIIPEASEQGAKNLIVLDISNVKDFNGFEAWKKLNGRMKQKKGKYSIILIDNNTVLKLSKQDILEGKAIEILSKIRKG